MTLKVVEYKKNKKDALSIKKTKTENYFGYGMGNCHQIINANILFTNFKLLFKTKDYAFYLV